MFLYWRGGGVISLTGVEGGGLAGRGWRMRERHVDVEIG